MKPGKKPKLILKTDTHTKATEPMHAYVPNRAEPEPEPVNPDPESRDCQMKKRRDRDIRRMIQRRHYSTVLMTGGDAPWRREEILPYFANAHLSSLNLGKVSSTNASGDLTACPEIPTNVGSDSPPTTNASSLSTGILPSVTIEASGGVPLVASPPLSSSDLQSANMLSFDTTVSTLLAESNRCLHSSPLRLSPNKVISYGPPSVFPPFPPNLSQPAVIMQTPSHLMHYNPGPSYLVPLSSSPHTAPNSLSPQPTMNFHVVRSHKAGTPGCADLDDRTCLFGKRRRETESMENGSEHESTMDPLTTESNRATAVKIEGVATDAQHAALLARQFAKRRRLGCERGD